MYADFGKWLRTARKRRRYTQKALGAKIGYSGAYISILENAVPHSESGGAVRPSEDFIEKVARELRVDEGQGRMLAGYREDPAPITLKEINRVMEDSCGGAVYISQDQPNGTLLDKETAERLISALKEFTQAVKK